jgi:UDP-N-acetylmuramyl pentapeptide phosphotransferase/UDP-N-acetylglucosamine-1-phosphate transferase
MTLALLMVILGAFAASVFLTARIRTLALRLGTMDVPNERSSHTIPTPRGGGASFVLITAAAAAWVAVDSGSEQFGAYVVTALVIAGISLLDDFRSLPAIVRLLVHIVAAAAAVFASPPMKGLPFLPAAIVFAATILWIVSLTNIFNFMDGIDGIAASQAGITLAALGAYAIAVDDRPLAMVCLAATASSLGFLALNWHPARIFMGDVGSAFLGFSIGVLSVLRGQPEAVGVAFAASWPFIFDATLTLLRRLLKGENIARSHRSHLYQRLTIAGYSHSRVASWYAASATVTAASGYLAARKLLPIWTTGLAMAGISMALLVLVRRAESGSSSKRLV